MFKSSTNPKDIKLFRKLGLKVFKDYEGREELFLGTVKCGYGYVKVFVTCMPAQFFRFEVVLSIDVRRSYNITTGSGNLCTYWPSIELMLEDMLVVEVLEVKN